jgi:2-polyprenyl-6-methoxyphenol hydroxylase-like FAD-dependent oxidoreductase
LQIGIIGCGVAGQAAAIALTRQGHDVTIVERFPEARPVGAGLLLQPSGLAVLQRLGLRAEAENWGAPIHRLEGNTVQGRRVLALDYGREHGLGIHRGALFNLLHNAVRASGVRLILGFDTAPSRTPMIRCWWPETAGAKDRSTSCSIVPVPMTRRAITLALRSARPSIHGERSGALCLIAMAVGPRHFARPMTALTMGILPIGRAPESDARCVAFFWSLPLAQADAQRAAGLDALKQQILRAWPAARRVVDEITSFDQFSLATYRDVVMRPWRRGRVLVMGDAAHGTSPQLGQGANLALIDALTIAHCLKGKADVDNALRRYEQMRRPHLAYYQLTSRLLTPMFQSNSRVMAWLRDNLLVAARYVPIGGYVTRTTLAGVRKLPWGIWRPPD